MTNLEEEYQKNIRETQNILQGFNADRETLIPILQKVQEILGYIPEEAMQLVADFLKIPEMDIYSVVTFYNQFRLNPPGKHQVRVCLGTACHMKGGYIVLDAWKRRLGIKAGETTEDREFDLDTVACVGCCTMAPVTVVDNHVEGKTSPTRVDGILLSYHLEKEKRSQESM